jgi:hypothetical protein
VVKVSEAPATPGIIEPVVVVTDAPPQNTAPPDIFVIVTSTREVGGTICVAVVPIVTCPVLIGMGWPP